MEGGDIFMLIHSPDVHSRPVWAMWKSIGRNSNLNLKPEHQGPKHFAISCCLDALSWSWVTSGAVKTQSGALIWDSTLTSGDQPTTLQYQLDFIFLDSKWIRSLIWRGGTPYFKLKCYVQFQLYLYCSAAFLFPGVSTYKGRKWWGHSHLYVFYDRCSVADGTSAWLPYTLYMNNWCSSPCLHFVSLQSIFIVFALLSSN